jgi:bacteriocin biosynthesis cyclodehydratase domain-containing protein
VRLDPRYPLVWRTPDSLQLGVAPPRAVLETVSAADERMISALVEGVSESGLAMIGHEAGASAEDVAALLTLVRPALIAPTTVPRRVLVMGTGHTATAIARAVASSGHTLVSEHPDLVIITAHYVVPPESHGMWLRRDIPHLPVVVQDSVVEIGPIVEPGAGPCLFCALRDASEADPAWPAMAAQLHQVRSHADTPLTAGEVAAIVARLVATRFERGRATRHESLSLDLATGTLTSRRRERREDCGCAGLRGQTESGSPGVVPDASRRHHRPRPTTATVVGALA